MNRKLFFLLYLIFPLFCLAQNGLAREYEYDAAGNRTLRKTLTVEFAPPAPQDSLTNYELRMTSDELSPSNFEGVDGEAGRGSLFTSDEFFVEKVAQVEIKIYPNPTTEKITMEISAWENLQTGVFKLYSLTGQLLQEQPVHSATTIVSLANLPNGVYILKVQINGRVEDWKIIKQ